MDEKFDSFSAKLDGLTDQEIEARIAAAIWVDDKQAFVLRYLEDKKLERRKAAKAEELGCVAPGHSQRQPWTWLRTHRQGETRLYNRGRGYGGSYRFGGGCYCRHLCEAVGMDRSKAEGGGRVPYVRSAPRSGLPRLMHWHRCVGGNSARLLAAMPIMRIRSGPCAESCHKDSGWEPD